MRILTICSTLDFQNYTRRATIEAIAGKAERLDILLYAGLKNCLTSKNPSTSLNTDTHHFWVPESLNFLPTLRTLESQMRKPIIKNKFSKYDVIFFTDPNQYRLLPYLEDQKVVYLIRDPNILQSEKHRYGEKLLLERANLVLATSKNLAKQYLPTYYSFQHPNIHYWPNCADLTLWNASHLDFRKAVQPIIGVAGNFSEKRTDYVLLEKIAEQMPDIQFEIAGIIDNDDKPAFWSRLLKKENVCYLGIIPLDDLPRTVARWHVGLVTDRVDEYASFMHHNKVYQYLALGVPAVSLKIHDDYEILQPYVQVANNGNDYIKAIEHAIEMGKSEKYSTQCRKLAEENSAKKRAKRFMSLIEKY